MKLHYPEDLVIGFQNREETMTGKLAYVVYKDGKKIRKEKSFNSWRDHEIEIENIKNIPRNGFLVSKSTKRSNYFGSGRSLLRMYDPEGFEFEITVDNLDYILKNCNTNKGELEGNFVYMWSGPELVLVPENSDVYNNSLVLKKDLSLKIKTSDLKIGGIYKDKKSENTFTYIGRYDYYKNYTKPQLQNYIDEMKNILVEPVLLSDSYNSRYLLSSTSSPIEKKPKKTHIFFDNTENKYINLSVSKLAYLISEDSDDFDELLSNYFKIKNAKKSVDFSLKKIKSSEMKNNIIKSFKENYYSRINIGYVHLGGNYYTKIYISNSGYNNLEIDEVDFDIKNSGLYYFDKKNVSIVSIDIIQRLLNQNNRHYYNSKLSKQDTVDFLSSIDDNERAELFSLFEDDKLSFDKFNKKDIVQQFKNKYSKIGITWFDYLIFNKLNYSFIKEERDHRYNNLQEGQIFYGGNFERCLENLSNMNILSVTNKFED